MLIYMRIKSITKDKINYQDPNNADNGLTISGWTTPNPPGVVCCNVEQAMEMDGSLKRLPPGGVNHADQKLLDAIAKDKLDVKRLQDKGDKV